MIRQSARDRLDDAFEAAITSNAPTGRRAGHHIARPHYHQYLQCSAGDACDDGLGHIALIVEQHLRGLGHYADRS